MDVARGQADQARTMPNPVIGLEAANIGVNDPTGLSQRETTLSLSQALELGGKREARIAGGDAEIVAAMARRSLALADFGYELAIAYAKAEAAQTRTQLLEDDVSRAQEDMRAARALVDAGKEADLRAVQAQVSASAADADLQAARADLALALANLSILAGAPEPYTSIGGSMLALSDQPFAPSAISAAFFFANPLGSAMITSDLGRGVAAG
ncbi:MAG: TolC family protein, partial [Hyphomonadaceae bacterium]